MLKASGDERDGWKCVHANLTARNRRVVTFDFYRPACVPRLFAARVMQKLNVFFFFFPRYTRARYSEMRTRYKIDSFQLRWYERCSIGRGIKILWELQGEKQFLYRDDNAWYEQKKEYLYRSRFEVLIMAKKFPGLKLKSILCVSLFSRKIENHLDSFERN